MPKVSVIIAVLNCVEYIQESVESALAQTYGDCEIIVVDGGSDDGTIDKLQPYLDKIQFIRQTGKGVANARNEAINISQGEYLTFLDGDDCWLPEKLETQVAYLENHLDVGLVFSDVYWINVEGVNQGRWFKDHIPVYEGYVLEKLLEHNFISTLTTCLRREVFNNVSGFNEDIYYAEDTDLWLRIAETTKVGYINQPLAVYRLRNESRSENFEEHYLSKIKIIEYAIKRNPALFNSSRKRKNQILGKQYYKLGYRLFAAGQRTKAVQALLEAIKKGYHTPKTLYYFLLSSFPDWMIKRLRMFKRQLSGQKRAS